MEKTSKIKTDVIHILLLFIAFAAMNLVNRYYYFIFIAVGLFCVTYRRKIQIDLLAFCCLSILALSILATSPETTASIFGVFKPFTYLFCYIMGMSLVKNNKADAQENNYFKLFYALVAATAIGSFIHYFLNWMTNLSMGATEQSLEVTRNTIDFWTKSTLSATGQASLACLGLGLAVACLFCDCGKKAKIASVIALIVIFAYNLILSGRTLFVMLFILVLVAFFYRMHTKKKGKIKRILLFLLIILLIVILFRADFLGVKSYFEESLLYQRFFAEDRNMELTDDGRMDRKLFYLQNMYKYPLGGAHMHGQVGYAHDIFLDTYDHYSVFAFLAILVYMASTLVRLVRCVADKTLPFAMRQIVLCIYISVYLEFMIEPILMGMPWLFACFCLIDGYLSRNLIYNKNLKLKSVIKI